MFNVNKVREDFPILCKKIKNKDLIYFDSAATTLKPKSVADRVYNHYLYESSNVHRGLHFLSDQATENFELSRKKVAELIGAETPEIIFTKGTTDSINIVAESFCSLLKTGSTILVSEIEHHSNIVPWQLAATRYQLNVKSFKVNEFGEVDFIDYENLLKNNDVGLVSFAYVSNSLGVELPVDKLTELAHKYGAKVLIDAAQAVAHHKIDIKKINCDFLVFSSHKMYGPTGVGVLYGKYGLLEKMPPVFGGGGMIDRVTIKETTYLEPPFRFEAGTPHIAGIIGLGEAVDYLKKFILEDISKYESEVTQLLNSQLLDIPEVRVFGNVKNKGPIISFIVNGENASDVGSLLDNDGIAVRAGHHCTQPLMSMLGVGGTLRASLAIYNTKDEVNYFIQSLKKVIKILKA